MDPVERPTSKAIKENRIVVDSTATLAYFNRQKTRGSKRTSSPEKHLEKSESTSRQRSAERRSHHSKPSSRLLDFDPE